MFIHSPPYTASPLVVQKQMELFILLSLDQTSVLRPRIFPVIDKIGENYSQILLSMWDVRQVAYFAPATLLVSELHSSSSLLFS